MPTQTKRRKRRRYDPVSHGNDTHCREGDERDEIDELWDDPNDDDDDDDDAGEEDDEYGWED